MKHTAAVETTTSSIDRWDAVTVETTSALGFETETLFIVRASGELDSRLHRFRSVDGWQVKDVDMGPVRRWTYTPAGEVEEVAIQPGQFLAAVATGQPPA